jgi:hypothetical protein
VLIPFSTAAAETMDDFQSKRESVDCIYQLLTSTWRICPSFLPISADSLVYHRAKTVLRKGTLFLRMETLFLVVFLCSAAALLYVSIPDTETVFKEKQHGAWDLGPYAGVDYNSLDLIVNSVVSYPPPIQRDRGGVGKISHIG